MTNTDTAALARLALADYLGSDTSDAEMYADPEMAYVWAGKFEGEHYLIHLPGVWPASCEGVEEVEYSAWPPIRGAASCELLDGSF